MAESDFQPDLAPEQPPHNAPPQRRREGEVDDERIRPTPKRPSPWRARPREGEDDRIREEHRGDRLRRADGVETFIPYKNPQGLIASYLGVFALIPCAGAGLGPAAFILGVMGYRYSRRHPTARGGGHAIAGIVLGLLTALGNWGAAVALLIPLWGRTFPGPSGGASVRVASPPAQAQAGGGPVPKAALEPVAAKGTTTLKGKVTLRGEKPNLAALTAAIHARDDWKRNQDFCLKGSPPEVSQQEYRIGDNNGVGNVFVWIEPEAGSYFPISGAQLAEAKKPVTLDQPHCAFIPHCFVLFTEYPDPKNPRKSLKTGQKLIVKNSASEAHNTNWKGGSANPGDNKLIAHGREIVADNLVPAKEEISFRCNIHGWMTAYARVFRHPYAAVSKAPDDPKDPGYGTYEIKGVPAGVKVRIIAWHEKAGFLTPSAKGVPLDLVEGETRKDFELEAK
jgi:hypothetical protein